MLTGLENKIKPGLYMLRIERVEVRWRSFMKLSGWFKEVMKLAVAVLRSFIQRF